MNHFVYVHIYNNILFVVKHEILIINPIIISVSNSQIFLYIHIYTLEYKFFTHEF